MREVRAAYCSKFKPDDGFEVYSDVYLDGIPSEKAPEPLKLGAPALRQIAAPRETAEDLTAAASIRPVIAALAKAKDINRVGQKSPRVPSIPVVQITEANRITEADIQRAKQELREKRDREIAAEMGGAA